MGIKAKLSAGFGIIAIIFVITNLIAYKSIKEINNNLTHLSENTLPSVRALLNIRIHQLSINTIEKDLMVTVLTDSMRDEAYNRLSRAIKREKEADSTYNALKKTEEEITMYKEFCNHWNTYLQTHDQFMALEAIYRRDKSEENYVAMCNFNLNEIQTAYGKVSKNVNKIIGINLEKAKANKEEAIRTQKKSYIVLLCSAIIGILLSILVSWYFTNSLKKDLGDEPKIVADYARQIAEGNLTLQVKNPGENTGILGAVEEMSKKIGHVIIHINNEIENTTNAGKLVSDASGQIADMATEQASSLEEIASSMQEMVTNLNKSTNNAIDTERIAQKVAVNINLSNEQVRETVEAINNITEKLKIIKDIANQTNILSLNAAVEAARAGEHGRGFAVVAAEVRKLSERSRLASEEINILSEKCVTSSNQALSQMEILVPEMNKTAELVKEISASDSELKTEIELINNSINSLNNVSQKSATVAEQLNLNAQNMIKQSEELMNSITYFHV